MTVFFISQISIPLFNRLVKPSGLLHIFIKPLRFHSHLLADVDAMTESAVDHRFAVFQAGCRPHPLGPTMLME